MATTNVVGATLFPHNSGLGATHDPALIRRIGTATAAETIAAGIDWAFGPTLTVPQDDRWGRAYEGYSEDPALVRAYAGEMILGLQGAPGLTGVARGHVAASPKHFLGDGGTHDGIDQGNTEVDEKTLIRIHSAGYPPAIAAGAMTVMASFNSWNGTKMHGNRALLTDVLKGRMGFAGFVVGDWNGHAQLPGCTATDCAATFNAGVDMAMAPDSWKGLFVSTLAHARSGEIPLSRINDAVRRILRVKMKLGLFHRARPITGRLGQIGSAEHRAVARQAVAESLVLLKNNGVLPIKPSANILVAGDAADDIGRQSGGWTLSWQGDGNSNADFPGATGIFAGIAEASRAGGGTATLSPDGRFSARPDVAIVVFGEQPYAEMRGDVRTLEFEPGDKQSLALLKSLKSKGIPTVAVFLSGRPMWVNPELNQSDAFVAAWFPGTEGGGIADVLIGPKRDFHGTLSYSWPRTAGQFVLNKGDAGYDPLFPLGFGLTYRDHVRLAQLGEVAGIDASLVNTSLFFTRGKVAAPFVIGTSGMLTSGAIDSETAQEGAARLPFDGAGAFRISGPTIDLTREANGDLNLQLRVRAPQAPSGQVALGLGGATVPINALLAANRGWQTIKIPLKCFRDKGVTVDAVREPLSVSSMGAAVIDLADARLATDPAGAVCP